MAESRIINVSGDKVGINGLDQALEELAEGLAGASDQEAAQALMARLEPRNYIPARCRDDYAAAFVRELRRHLGQPYTPEARTGLEIRVVGPGCPRCEQLYERVVKVMAQAGMAGDLDKIKDTKEIAASGVLVTPGLIINGKVVSVGKVPSESQLKSWLERENR